MFRALRFLVVFTLSVAGLAAFASGAPQRGSHGKPATAGGTWQRTVNLSPGTALCTPLLLTDGSVILQQGDDVEWYRLTPDINGSYVNGTWTQIGSLPSNYGPLYFGSAVLADGRVVIIGGEYNFGSAVWTNQGAVYDPLTNVWTAISPPAGWSNIGDCQTCVSPDGHFIIANPYDTRMASLDPTTMAWTALAGTGKADRFDEEGWALLPDGSILTVDALNAPNTERYSMTLDQWQWAGTTPQSLEDPGSQELGPMVLRPDGTLFAAGATGHNAVFDYATGLWSAAPDFPNIGGQLDIADGPACLLPDGNVLCLASPGVFNPPSYFFEFDGTNLNLVPGVPNSPSEPSSAGNLLVLPTGQALFTDQSNDVEIYTPTNGSFNPAWQPTITSVDTTVQQSSVNNLIQGTQLNGLSQANGYGDDLSNATNYPLVRVQNASSGHVFYMRTHSHSTMAVATGSKVVSTQFDVPSGVEIGPSNLFVVANGIPSNPQPVNVVAPHVVLPFGYSLVKGKLSGGSLSSLFYADGNVLAVQDVPTATANEPPVQIVLMGTSTTSSPTSFQFQVTANVSTNGTAQSLALFNYSTGKYDVLDTRAIGPGNVTVTVTATGNLSHYVGAAGAIQAEIFYTRVGPTQTSSWTANVDLANWIIQ